MTLVKKFIIKNAKFKICDDVRISKYKNIFVKGYNPNWSEEVFVIKKFKNTVTWTYVINDLNGEEIVGPICENKLQKINQREFRIEKVIKKKDYNYMLNGKVMVTRLIVGEIKKRHSING